MTFRDIIVPLQPEPTQEARTPEAFAIALAARSEAHLSALAPSFSYVAESAGVRLPAGIREDLRARSDEAARAAVVNFEGRARAAGVLYKSEIVRAGPSDFSDRFARRARTCDLSVVPQSDPSANGWETEVIEAVLFDSGRPVLIVPYVHTGRATFRQNPRGMGRKQGGRTRRARCAPASRIRKDCRAPDNPYGAAPAGERHPGSGSRDPSCPTWSQRDREQHGCERDRDRRGHVVSRGRQRHRSHGHGWLRSFAASASGLWRRNEWNPEVDDRACSHGALMASRLARRLRARVQLRTAMPPRQ